MRGRGRGIWACGVVFLVYALLTLFMTYPLIARLGTHLAGDGDDMWVHYWNGWWVKRVLRQGGDLYHTDLLFHPAGVSLLYHNFAWVNILLWLVLEPIVGGIAAYNLVYLLHIPLCGLGMFLLARRLTRSNGAALVSGLAFAFWPYRMLDANHPNMIATEGLPFLMLALLCLLQEKRPLRDGVVAGLVIALVGYVRWQLLVLAGSMVLLYLCYTLIWERERWSWRAVGGLALMVGLALALMAPALYPFLRDQLAGGSLAGVYAVNVTDHKQDLAAWIVPQSQHPLSGLYDRLFQTYAATMTRRHYSAFIGPVVLGLAVVGVVKRRAERETWFWVGLAASSFLLALGPYLHLDGVCYTSVFLPYRLVGWLPPVKILRYPHRFNALLAVPLAVLAGYGTSVLRGWSARRGRWLARSAVLAAGLLVVLDYLSVPTAIVPARVPGFYSALVEERGDFAIVGVPGARRDTERYMFYQTVHGRPLLGGHVSRLPPQALEFASSVPLTAGLYEGGEMDTQLPDVSRQLSLLAGAGFRYIVLHKDMLSSERLAAYRSYLVAAPRYEDGEVVVYSTAPVVELDCPLKYDLGAGVGLIEAALSVDTVRPDAILELEAVWGTVVAPGMELLAEVSLVDGDGEVGQAQRFAISPVWPPSEWPANAIVRGVYPLQIKPWLKGGTYDVAVRLLREDGVQVGRRVGVGDVVMQAPERSFAVPQMARRSGATFDNSLRLLGYDLETEADVLHVTLHWQALRRMDIAYKIFVHLLDPGGALVAQTDVMPRDWSYPTTWWEAGEVVSDDVELSLEGVPTGSYRLTVGVYDPASMERLAVQDSSGWPLGDRVVLEAGWTVGD